MPSPCPTEARLENAASGHATFHFGSSASCRSEPVGSQRCCRWVDPWVALPSFRPERVQPACRSLATEEGTFHLTCSPHGLHAELLDCLLKPHAFRRCPALQSLGLGQTPLFVPHLLPVFLVTGEFCLSGVQKTAVVTPSAWPLPKWLVEVVYNGVLRKDGDLGPGIEVEVVHDAHHAQGLAWPRVVVTQQPTNRGRRMDKGGYDWLLWQ